MTPEMARKRILDMLLGAGVKGGEDGRESGIGCIVGFVHPPQGNCTMLVEWNSGERTTEDITTLTGEDVTSVLDTITQWANCHEASVSGEGNIWIANPQTGHWLTEDELVEFVEWLDQQ